MPSLPDRPKAITVSVQREIVRLIRGGNYYSTACLAAGTTPEAVDYWKRLVEAGAEHAQVYADFFRSLARAQAKAESDAVENIREQRGNWQGESFFIQRRFAKRWALKQIAASEEPDEPHAYDEHGDEIKP